MSLIYNYAKTDFVTGALDWDTVDSGWKIILVSNSYTANADHQYVSSASIYELNGTNYESGYQGAGRKDLGGMTVTTNTTTDKAYMDANDVSWTAIDAGVANAAIIIWETGGSDATSKLVMYIDGNGFPVTTNGGDLNIAWSASGIINVV